MADLRNLYKAIKENYGKPWQPPTSLSSAQDYIGQQNQPEQVAPALPTLPSDYQYGLQEGMGTQDVGDGKYDIYDANGGLLGQGYKSAAEAAKEYLKKNALASVSPGSKTTFKYNKDYSPTEDDAPEDLSMYNRIPGMSSFYENLQKQAAADGRGAFTTTQGYNYGKNFYSTEDEAKAAASGVTFGGYQAPQLSDWEVLGQALNGASSSIGMQEWGGLPTNGVDEKVSGENTLYGSTPVFYDGKLIGYKSDLAPGTETMDYSDGPDKRSANPFGYSASHNGRSHSWSTGIGRSIDPTAYKGLIQGLGGTEYYVPLENVSKLPGWTNKESYQHQDNKGGWGWLGQIFDFVDPILDTIDPMHNKVQGWLTGSKETAGQRPLFEAIVPMVVDAFLPGVGSIIGGVNSASKGDSNGVLSSVASYGLGSAMSGTNLGMGEAGSALNATTNAAAKGAISGAVSGGIYDGWSGAGKGALAGAVTGGIGGATGGAGGIANSLGINPTIASMLYSGGTNALGQLFRKGDVNGTQALMAAGQSGLSNLFKG